MFCVESLKTLTNRVVDKLGDKSRAKAAAICGVSEMTISNWCDENKPQYLIPVLHLFALDEHSGNLVLKEFARARGFELMARTTKHEAAAPAGVGPIVKLVGDFACTVEEAEADGHICPREDRDIAEKGLIVADLIHSKIAQIRGH